MLNADDLMKVWRTV